jgi:hypothetical protein
MHDLDMLRTKKSIGIAKTIDSAAHSVFQIEFTVNNFTLSRALA